MSEDRGEEPSTATLSQQIRERLDLDAIHAYLSRRVLLGARASRARSVARSIAGSLPIGIYRDDAQVGFARVVTDDATFAWLADVYVLESERGRGIGKALVEFVARAPGRARAARAMVLATLDAHGLYERYGFESLRGDERFMALEARAPVVDGGGG